jgi:oligoendopeptidase F
LAEVASTFGEALVYNELLKKNSDNITKIAILSKKIEGAINTILRQTAFHLFEKELHEKRKINELTETEISAIWKNQMKDHLGDAFEIGDEVNNIWSYVSHFIHHPFYVYSYSFSEMITYSLYSIYSKLETQSEKESFSEKYMNFITDMPVVNYEELLLNFGLNAGSEDFWQKAIDEIAKDIDQLEILLKKEKLIS